MSDSKDTRLCKCKDCGKVLEVWEVERMLTSEFSHGELVCYGCWCDL